MPDRKKEKKTQCTECRQSCTVMNRTLPNSPYGYHFQSLLATVSCLQFESADTCGADDLGLKQRTYAAFVCGGGRMRSWYELFFLQLHLRMHDDASFGDLNLISSSCLESTGPMAVQGVPVGKYGTHGCA
eukprot:366775-Pelagomonas_calceolata.AAC.3